MEHNWNCGEDDDGWLVVRCACGWELGIVPDDDYEQAGDALMDHAAHQAQVEMMRKFGRAFDELHRFIVAELDPDPADTIGAYIGDQDLARFATMCQGFARNGSGEA